MISQRKMRNKQKLNTEVADFITKFSEFSEKKNIQRREKEKRLL